MKFWEAMKALQEGEYIRLTNWKERLFIRADEYGVIYDQDNNYFYNLDDIMLIDGWEIIYK